MTDPRTPGPTVRPTRPGHVALAAVVGVATTWLTLDLLARFGLALPQVGPVAWASVGLLAGATAWLAVSTHAAVQRRREPMDPDRAVARLVLGKTSVLAGALVAGAYLAVVVHSLGGAPAPLPQARALHGSIAALLAAGWAVAGVLLERACRIPRDPDDDPTDTTGAPGVDDGSGRPPEVA